MPIGNAELDYVRELVHKKAAIVLEPSKQYLVESRLAPLAREAGCDTIDAFVHRVRTSPFGALHTRVIEAMTTNETSFFRDVHPFDVLRDKVLPEIVKERQKSRSIFVWCAASSTGQEPYSIAMTVRQHFPELASWNVKILATDLSTDVLERAKRATYSQLEVSRGLPEPYLRRFFDETQKGVEWRARREIVDMVEYKQLNIIDPWPQMPAPDVVFIRNILIYFSVEVKKRILDGMRCTMAQDGALFLGAAETTLGISQDFERVALGRGVYYRPKAKR
jgi:chemotaxis protein methyltransferase CheR